MNSIRYGRARRTRAAAVNMTPLIDMVFILLIFFIVTTSFVRESGVEVRRPQAQTAQAREKVNMVLGVSAEGVVYAEGRPIDVRSVRAYMERFLAETPEGSVVIAADERCPAGLVIQVLDGCRLAGVRDVSVAARRP
jgi:biopolymer transport protein ExbD